MGRLMKYLIYLVLIVLMGLVGYSFFGDLSAPTENFKQEIQIDTVSS